MSVVKLRQCQEVGVIISIVRGCSDMKYEYRQNGDWSTGRNNNKIVLAICCLAHQFTKTGLLSTVNTVYLN